MMVTYCYRRLSHITHGGRCSEAPHVHARAKVWMLRPLILHLLLTEKELCVLLSLSATTRSPRIHPCTTFSKHTHYIRDISTFTLQNITYKLPIDR